MFFRPFERDWIDECEDIKLNNKDASERWTFPNNGTSGQLMEIPLLEWNTYLYDYYLIHIFIQAVHGFHISNSKSHQELGEFEPMPTEEICVYNPFSIENLEFLTQGLNIRDCSK